MVIFIFLIERIFNSTMSIFFKAAAVRHRAYTSGPTTGEGTILSASADPGRISENVHTAEDFENVEPIMRKWTHYPGQGLDLC